MQNKNSSFKETPKKHLPKGLTILHEDINIIVVDKVEGLLTIASDKEKLKTAHHLLNEYVKKGNIRSKNRVFIVHRLDRETSGILIFAKNEKAKVYLQENWKNFSKTYLAIVHGQVPENEGIITSYLAENKALKVFSVKNPEEGKIAETKFKVQDKNKNFTLLNINLLTGRKHQIRVHFSEKGHPVVGDKVYSTTGKNFQRLALHSSSLTITHPFTKKPITFTSASPLYFNTLMKMK